MIEADDDSLQEGAGRFRHQQSVMNTREWFDDELQVKRLEQQLEDRAPAFTLAFRLWWPAALILLLVILYQIGVPTMSHDDSQPPPSPPVESPTSTQPARAHPPKPLQVAIQRFAKATIDLSTHPDTQMFFFDAQELTVNEKLQGLKLQALIDLLCARGIIERTAFENRLEDLVLQKAQKLEEGVKQLALGALHARPVVMKPNGH